MKEKLVSVTTYHLSGDDVTITFSMKDPEIPELVYKDKLVQKPFLGPAIDQEKIELGLVVSVCLDESPDSHTTVLSLAVPAGNRSEDLKSIPVKTFAVRTTHRTSIGGPDLVEGQIQTYETYVLEGNAW
jgi:hypothetical protein